jgi:hypothetical protein
MRRSIAAVLIASGLIMVAAGCKVTTTQKQAVARELTSAILSSVFLIESQGHHQENHSGAIQTATVVAPLELSAEPIEAAPPAGMESVGDTSTAMREAQSARAATGDRCRQERSSRSPQVIRTKAMEMASSALTPATVNPLPETLPISVHYAEGLAVASHVSFKPLTACLRNEARSAATAMPMAKAKAMATVMNASLSQSENAVVVCRLTIARHGASQEIEKQRSDCQSLRTRSRIEATGSRRIVVVNANVTSDEQELSTLVRNSLCFVTTGPSN